ncbi:MAG: lipocalin-like domain-containing protein [Nitrospirota bacterium]
MTRSRTVTWLLTGLVFAGSLAGPARGPVSAGVEFRPALAGYAYRFPADHGAHEEFRTEWWYYTGHLSSGDGRRFGFQLTFFRRGVEQESARASKSRWAIRHLYLAHLALSDHDRGRFRFAEKVSRAGLGKAGAESGRLHVWIDRWSAEARPGEPERHRLKAQTDGFAIDLVVAPEKPPVIHGEDSVSRKGRAPEQASHYYSLPRLATTGSLTVDGERLAVTGTSWMDHEFGSGDLAPDQVGWDWFSVQLDDRTELMLYRLRRTDGTVDPSSSGTLVFPDGRTRHLRNQEIRVESLDSWLSAASGARYPSRWRIAVPESNLSLELTPLLASQELITRRSTQVTYWEGAVRVTGRRDDKPVSGLGYVELTGYAERFKQRL